MNSGNFAYECMLALYCVLGLWSIAKFHLSTKTTKRFLMLSGTCEANSFIFSFSVFVRKSLVDRLSCLLSALEFQIFSGLCTVCNGTLTIESEDTFS